MNKTLLKSCLQNLRRLFHDQAVVLEAQVNELLPDKGRMRTGHRDDFGVGGEQIVASVPRGAEKLEGVALLDLGEKVAEEP